jgi:hypothetical protein
MVMPAHAQEDGRSDARRGSAASDRVQDAQAGSDLQRGNPSLHDYGYYETAFQVDQYARVAVRCLGVEGSPAVTVRFRLEVHNASERDVRVRGGEARLQWTRRGRGPRAGRFRPHVVEGVETIEPDETSEIHLGFRPRGHLNPKDVHRVQLQWTLRSSYGVQSVHLSTFVRDGHGDQVRYAFAPHTTRHLGSRVDPWRRHRRR